MSVTIDTELKNFKDKVGNSLDSMKNAVTNLADKLSTAIASNNSTKDSLSANYKSENKEAVLSKFTSMNKKYDKIKNSVTGELNSALSSSQVLIDNVTKLEELKQAIEDAEAKKKSAESSRSSCESGSSEYNHYSSIISEASREIETKTKSFNELQDSSKQLLESLKNLDANSELVSGSESALSVSELAALKSGYTFDKFSYRASNGETVFGYMYVPKFSTDVEGVPVSIFLHGSGEFENGAIKAEMGRYLDKGTVQPNGIVIVPQGTSDHGWRKDPDWNKVSYQDALIEYTNKVVEDYNGDPNRISIMGHSLGGFGALSFASHHPNYFSAVVCSGGGGDWVKGNQGYKNLATSKVILVSGTNDSNVRYERSVKVVNKMKSLGLGNSVQLITLKGRDHGITSDLYNGKALKFDIMGEKNVSVVDWAMSISREEDA